MDLLEEYWKRHKISSPLIRFPNHGYLVCRHKVKGDSTGDPRFVVFFINYHKKADTPPYLRVSCNLPIHDNSGSSITGGNHTTRVIWDKRIEFEEWENFVTEWSDSLRSSKTDVVKPEEIHLAIWEMFVYTNDQWLSQNLPPNLYDSLTTVIDDEKGTDVRIEAAKVVESWLNSRIGRSQSALSVLTKTYEPQSYAAWLASMLSTV